MSALAHYFEDEGLATTLIALVRENAEVMRPPRALWVPFELGRPFGDPGNTAQQSCVLAAALELLDKPGSDPILTNFEDKLGVYHNHDDWQSPANLDSSNVLSELTSLADLWETARRRYGRTTVGISGLSPQEAVEFINRYHAKDPMPNPKGMARVSRARYAIDDIKAFYLETAAAVGGPSSIQLLDWFWQETLAGAMIMDFQERSRLSEDKNLELISDSIVPAERVISWNT